MGRGRDGGGGGGGARKPNRVTLKFAGPPLALPGEAPRPAGTDTGELRLPDAEDRRDAGDAAEQPGADAWTRLRDSEAPGRPRSLSPHPAVRAAALDLVSERSRPPSSPALDLVADMLDRHALGDFTGALLVAELVLGRSPQDERAQRCAESCRERLIQIHSARLASLAAIAPGAIGARAPRVTVPEHEIRWLGLDHRQGFLLSRIDGRATIEDLVDLGGMTRLDVLRTLVELVEAGAVSLD